LRKWVDQDDRRDGSRPLFPSATGKPLTRSSIARRLELAAGKAAVTLPELSKRTVSPHIIRHSTAMHLLQSGVDISVIALWLGHESPTTTHVYLSADMAMKEEALLRLQPADVGRARYEAPDNLLAFLKSL
jgi:site-specific recombinase XerD